MITIILSCYHCGSENLVRNGRTRNGKQRYLCHECGRTSRDNPSSPAYPAERREEILRAYQECSSLRGLSRTFGVSRNTVSSWLKKAQPTTSSDPNTDDPAGTADPGTG